MASVATAAAAAVVSAHREKQSFCNIHCSSRFFSFAQHPTIGLPHTCTFTLASLGHSIGLFLLVVVTPFQSPATLKLAPEKAAAADDDCLHANQNMLTIIDSHYTLTY